MARFVALLLAVLLSVVVGCHKNDATADLPTSSAPPEVTDATTGLMLTWIDEKGEFHTEQKVSDVPMVSRDPVRVRVADLSSEAPPDKVFLADLRNALADGKYKVRVAGRDEFENVAVERRKKSGVAVLSPQPPANPDPIPGPIGTDTIPTSRPTVIIYGASWCGPCHQAQAYLTKRNIPFVDKDIEEDRNAAKEMRAKLTKAGMRNGSIPVIDVKGKILIGFDPGSIERALAAP